MHFTPEYLDRYDFQRRERDYFLPYFVRNEDHLNRALRTCLACHIIIHHLFNDTLDGAFQRSEAWCRAMRAIGAANERFYPEPLQGA